MILTWENRLTYTETCPGVTLSTTTNAQTVHEPNQDLRGERVLTDPLSNTKKKEGKEQNGLAEEQSRRGQEDDMRYLFRLLNVMAIY